MLWTISATSLLLTGALALHDYFKQPPPSTAKSIRIVLTGGPCGGKSQGILCLYRSFKSIAAPFFIVPQAATIIGTAGIDLDLSQCQPRQIQLFQIYLMRLQYSLESIVASLASKLQKFQKTPVLLCDRGMLDGKAYCTEENWQKMLTEIRLTQNEILGRYDAVVHMVTAAKGAQSSYRNRQSQTEISNGDNQGLKVRQQDIKSAKDLDDRLLNCYKNHRNRFVVCNDFYVQNFEDKKTILLAQVYMIISQIIRINNLLQYYEDFHDFQRRKCSSDQDDQEVSPYLIRKRKLKKFSGDRRKSIQDIRKEDTIKLKAISEQNQEEGRV